MSSIVRTSSYLTQRIIGKVQIGYEANREPGAVRPIQGVAVTTTVPLLVKEAAAQAVDGNKVISECGCATPE